jgi:hypothetical protein
LDRLNDFLGPVSKAARVGQQLIELAEHRAPLRGANDANATASTGKGEHSFVTKHSKCAKHGVLVDLKVLADALHVAVVANASLDTGRCG